VHIPYPSDLTEAGNLYACRWLALDFVRASNLDLAPLRRLSAEIAADLSLRRYLAQEHIPFNFVETEPFTHPDRNEIILGRRPCHVINAWIARKSHIDRLQGSPAALLSAPACVSEAAIASEKWGYQDLLIFAFALAVPKLARQAISNAQAEGNSDYRIYILPKSWRNASYEATIPGLAIQSASDGEITLELGGQTIHRDFVSQTLQLAPSQSAMAVQGFTRLAYLSTRQALTATISVHNIKLNRTLRITPDQWGNLWIDGVEIVLAGYIEVGDFRRRARRFRPSARHWELACSSPPSLSLPIQDLLPLPQLVAWLHRIQESS
jgi:hypothetical protein